MERVDAHTRASLTMKCATNWFGVRIELISAPVALLVTILIFINPSKLSAALLALCLTYCLTMVAQFQWAAIQLAESQTLVVSAQRIEEYAELPAEEDNGGEQGLMNTPADWPSQGEIQFQNYSLRYRPELESTLKNVNLHIEAEEKIGIIGRTGAGKSSIFQALFRLVDRSCVDGQILIDNVDISRITLNQLRSNLSIIPQTPILFSGTLRYNLDPAKHFSDEQCWKALADVQLKQRVASDPNGLDLFVSESGSNFSVGECQLICIARAVLRHSKILLIDEATANVDQTTDGVIQTVIREKFRNRTILAIAHRLSTVAQSDRILVMEKGRVANFDVPNNIINYDLSQ